jgi:hypothetical protein
MTNEKENKYEVMAANIIKQNKIFDDLIAACEAAFKYLDDQMDDAERLEHTMNGCDASVCVYCQLREAISKASGE